MPAADMTNMTTEPKCAGLEKSLPCLDLDSLASQEEDEDNLPIWIDGDEHWITGVDANTTCADLICALLSYRSVQQQQMYRQEGLMRSHRSAPPPVKAPQEYAIVQKQRHYEEYLDGSARLCDVIASRHALPKEEEECQLQLRHLATTTSRKHTPTTDKDSGMGSPVDSSRSMRLRRRGKSKVLPATVEAVEQWSMTRANPKQPKRSRRVQQQARGSHASPNESLLNIILAQDETILQQMSMLHDKDRQILKIEEEKHRVRERELGKNYLLETYLKDLEEPQENGPPARQSSKEGLPNRQEEADAEVSDNGSRTSNVEGSETVKDEICFYWLEKIHAVNKNLQREEELLLSLHAKVRRHQVKRVYETKSEVLVQIDRLDTQLAAQVADIHRVERKLFTANEQLKAKLGVLESLGREFETTVTEEEPQREEAQKLARLMQTSSPADKQPPVVLEAASSDLGRRCLTQQELTDRNLNGHQRPMDKGLTKLLFKGRSSSPNPSASFPFVSGRDLTPVEQLGTLV